MLRGAQDSALGLNLDAWMSLYHPELFIAFPRARVGILVNVMKFALLKKDRYMRFLIRTRQIAQGGVGSIYGRAARML